MSDKFLEIENIKKPFATILRVLGNDLGKIVLVNFYFLLTSLLVVTIPFSALAMTRVIYDIVLGKSPKVTAEFFRHFKSYFKNGLLLTLFSFVIVGVLAFSAYFYLANKDAGVMNLSLSLLSVVILAIFLGFANCLTVILSRVDLKFSHGLKDCFALFFGKPLLSLVATFFYLAILLASVYFLPFTLIAVVTLTFSIPALISVAIFVNEIEENFVE